MFVLHKHKDLEMSDNKFCSTMSVANGGTDIVVSEASTEIPVPTIHHSTIDIKCATLGTEVKMCNNLDLSANGHSMFDDNYDEISCHRADQSVVLEVGNDEVGLSLLLLSDSDHSISCNGTNDSPQQVPLQCMKTNSMVSLEVATANVIKCSTIDNHVSHIISEEVEMDVAEATTEVKDQPKVSDSSITAKLDNMHTLDGSLHTDLIQDSINMNNFNHFDSQIEVADSATIDHVESISNEEGACLEYEKDLIMDRTELKNHETATLPLVAAASKDHNLGCDTVLNDEITDADTIHAIELALVDAVSQNQNIQEDEDKNVADDTGPKESMVINDAKNTEMLQEVHAVTTNGQTEIADVEAVDEALLTCARVNIDDHSSDAVDGFGNRFSGDVFATKFCNTREAPDLQHSVDVTLSESVISRSVVVSNGISENVDDLNKSSDNVVVADQGVDAILSCKDITECKSTQRNLELNTVISTVDDYEGCVVLIAGDSAERVEMCDDSHLKDHEIKNKAPICTVENCEVFEIKLNQEAGDRPVDISEASYTVDCDITITLNCEDKNETNKDAESSSIDQDEIEKRADKDVVNSVEFTGDVTDSGMSSASKATSVVDADAERKTDAALCTVGVKRCASELNDEACCKKKTRFDDVVARIKDHASSKTACLPALNGISHAVDALTSSSRDCQVHALVASAARNTDDNTTVIGECSSNDVVEEHRNGLKRITLARSQLYNLLDEFFNSSQLSEVFSAMRTTIAELTASRDKWKIIAVDLTQKIADLKKSNELKPKLVNQTKPVISNGGVMVSKVFAASNSVSTASPSLLPAASATHAANTRLRPLHLVTQSGDQSIQDNRLQSPSAVSVAISTTSPTPVIAALLSKSSSAIIPTNITIAISPSHNTQSVATAVGAATAIAGVASAAIGAASGVIDLTDDDEGANQSQKVAGVTACSPIANSLVCVRPRGSPAASSVTIVTVPRSMTAAAGAVRQPAAEIVKSANDSAALQINTPTVALSHPAPPPSAPVTQFAPAGAKDIPPKPAMKCTLSDTGICLSWTAPVMSNHEEITFFQLYSYQQTAAPPSTSLWRKIGNVKALPLPMACTLSQFQSGNKYYFAVRAMDAHHRVGAFSDPTSISLDAAPT